MFVSETLFFPLLGKTFYTKLEIYMGRAPMLPSRSTCSCPLLPETSFATCSSRHFWPMKQTRNHLLPQDKGQK